MRTEPSGALVVRAVGSGLVGRLARVASIALALCACRSEPVATQRPETSATGSNAAPDATRANDDASDAGHADNATEAPTQTASAGEDSGSHAGDAELAASYESQGIRAVKAIGHTSVVWKVTFADGRVAAYKPESVRGRLRYRGEVAAFRLQRALAVTRVPPAMFVSLSQASLASAAMNDETRTLMKSEQLAHDGRVRGALMPWIPGLSFIPLESEPTRSRWRAWLSANGALEGPDHELAGEIAELVVFDALTGNWDRWSGANVGLDAKKEHLLFVDNDGAFFDPVPKGPYDAQLAIVKRVDRFPREVVARARALTMDALDAALGTDETGAPLLSPSQRRGILARRDDVLAIIDAKVKALGDDKVLYF